MLGMGDCGGATCLLFDLINAAYLARDRIRCVDDLKVGRTRGLCVMACHLCDQ